MIIVRLAGRDWIGEWVKRMNEVNLDKDYLLVERKLFDKREREREELQIERDYLQKQCQALERAIKIYTMTACGCCVKYTGGHSDDCYNCLRNDRSDWQFDEERFAE